MFFFSSWSFLISDNLAKGLGITGVGYGWDYEVLAGVYLVVKRTLQKRGLQKRRTYGSPNKRGLFGNLWLLGCSVLVVMAVNAICMKTISAHAHL